MKYDSTNKEKSFKSIKIRLLQKGLQQMWQKKSNLPKDLKYSSKKESVEKIAFRQKRWNITARINANFKKSLKLLQNHSRHK